MKLPIRQITDFVRSPKGKRMLRDARTRIDTPQNRERAADAFSRLRGAGRRGPAGSGGR